MARGEVEVASRELRAVHETDLPYGAAITSSGRLSGVTEPGALSVLYPFSTKQLVFLDDALTYASRGAKARFAVYLGDLGDDTGARAREVLAEVPDADDAVLLAISPNQRIIEVVWGTGVSGRGIESAAPLGIAAAAAAFRTDDDFADGIISALRVISAGVSPD